MMRQIPHYDHGVGRRRRGDNPVAMAVTELATFVSANRIMTLNVAGPRSSKQPLVYSYVLQLIGGFLASCSRPDPER
jgi:hypothetical protein